MVFACTANIFTHEFNIACMHAAKGRYSAKFRENLSNGLLALVYTHEMYPLYGIYICLHVHV